MINGIIAVNIMALRRSDSVEGCEEAHQGGFRELERLHKGVSLRQVLNRVEGHCSRCLRVPGLVVESCHI